MKDSSYSKALVSSLFPLPEYDSDEDTENKEIDAELEADMLDIIDNIGTDEFKNLYELSKQSFKKAAIDTQIRFCIDILNKIAEVNNFPILNTIYYNSISDINDVYEFLEFLEFKNITFLEMLLNGLILDLRNINEMDLLEKNWETIIDRVNEFTKKSMNQLINSFLLMNTKNNLMQFFSGLIKKNMIDVTIRFMENKNT